MDQRKKMKWIIFGIGAAILAAGVIAGMFSRGKHSPDYDTDSIDGGVVKRNDGADYPKTVVSKEITSFDGTFSLIAYADETRLERGVYTLVAILEDGMVKGSYKCSIRDGRSQSFEFESDLSFMDKLYEIVAKYDFARYNGCTHTVSGLPHMYGACLDIQFVSGESIYSKDNQDNFLPIEAIDELEALFAGHCK